MLLMVMEVTEFAHRIKSKLTLSTAGIEQIRVQIYVLFFFHE
jgi:hypothetical protein